jgi:hypothetical protein
MRSGTSMSLTWIRISLSAGFRISSLPKRTWNGVDWSEMGL